jgi:hypothetical protein
MTKVKAVLAGVFIGATLGAYWVTFVVWVEFLTGSGCR